MNYKSILTEENLCKWYWDERLSSVQIAARVGCSDATVRNYMNKHDVPRRARSEIMKMGRADPTTAYNTEEYRQARAVIAQSMWADEEFRRKQSDLIKASWTDERRCNQSEATKAQWADEGFRHEQSEITKARWADEEFRHKISGIYASEKYQCKMSEAAKARWADEEYRRKMFEVMADEEFRRKRSERAKARWANDREYRESMSGENHPNWQGGISREPYSWEFDEEFKCWVRERDNYTCAICGECWEEGNRAYPVHHIDYDKSNTTMENCITLCYSCHTKTNSNRDYWQRVLISLIWKRAEQVALPLL